MSNLPHEIGALVLFKGRGLGVGRITKFYEKENLYGIEIIGKAEWVRSAPEHFFPIEEDDVKLVTALDGVGLF
jgi:hypothetical protein